MGAAVPIIGAGHIPVGNFATYNTNPPTSGSHWAAPAECGIYDEELPDERVVHNMEHGHVIISYNLPELREAVRLLQLAEDLPNLESWGIVRPYSKIDPGTVAITAWGVIDQVQGVDEQRIRKFYDTYIRNRLSNKTASVGAIGCK